MPLDFSQRWKNCPLKNMYIFYPAWVRKNSQEIYIVFNFTGKKGRNLQESNRGGSLQDGQVQ